MKTREEILSLISHHVTAVNYIYRDTKFDGRLQHRNIKFEVQRIKVIIAFLNLMISHPFACPALKASFEGISGIIGVLNLVQSFKLGSTRFRFDEIIGLLFH